MCNAPETDAVVRRCRTIPRGVPGFFFDSLPPRGSGAPSRGPAAVLGKADASRMGWDISHCALHPSRVKRLETQAARCRICGLALG